MKTYLVALLLIASWSPAFAQNDLAELHNRIAAVCPIDGVSIGNPADKATWRFAPKAGSTAQQRANAQAVIDGWGNDDWNGTPAQRRLKALRQIEDWQLRILALERLKIRIPAREVQIQAVIDNLDAQIEALIPQT